MTSRNGKTMSYQIKPIPPSESACNQADLKFPWISVAILMIGLAIAMLSHNNMPIIRSDGIGYSAYLRLYIILNLYLTGAYWKGYIPPEGAKLRTYLRVVQMPLRALLGSSLKEGESDSGKKDGLAADLKIVEVHRQAGRLVVKAKVRNTGTALWLSDPGRGTVYMADRPFENPDCEGAAVWEWRENSR